MKNTKYWIAAISKEHTLRGVEGGFIQVCHGKKAPLKRMSKGDWLIVYSSKVSMNNKEKCQNFTAIAQLEKDELYRVQMTNDFFPFRRNIKFYKCNEVSILPLICNLDFILNKKSWGYPFRFGFFEISEHDFYIIASKMLVNNNDKKYVQL